MEFAASARKHYAEHGISDADALHVIRNPFRLIEQQGDYEGHLLIIGVDRGARLQEVVVIPADDPDESSTSTCCSQRTMTTCEVMTMTTKANKATAAEQWLDQLDPADPTVKVRDGRYLRHVREAADATDVAADDLRRAVAEARTNGESWGTIGMVLGVTRQAAQQRFRDVEA